MEGYEIGQILILAVLALYGIWELISAIKKEYTKPSITQDQFDPKALIKEYKELVTDIHKEVAEKIKHQRIRTEIMDSPLKETVYLSNYLFLLSVVGLVIMGIGIGTACVIGGIQSYLLVLLLFLGTLLLASRINHHAIFPVPEFTAVFGIASAGISIYFIHVITGLSYIHSLFSFIVCCGFFGGTLHAIIEFNPIPAAVVDNYSYTVGTLLFFLQIGFILLLVTGELFFLSLLFGGMWLEANLKFHDRRKKGRNIEKQYYTYIKKFLHSVPFQSPLVSHSLQKDFIDFCNIKKVFKEFSLLEIVYWGLMTPLILVPLVCYTQLREEKIAERKKMVMELATKKYLISAHMVADVLNVELLYAYRILNDLYAEERLKKYGSPGEIVYGVLDAEMEDMLSDYLQSLKLDKKERELLRYFKGQLEKARTPVECAELEILKIGTSVYEISVEHGKRAAKYVRDITVDTKTIENLMNKLDFAVRLYIGYRAYGGALEYIQTYAERLYDMITFFEEDLDVLYILLETNVPDIPWELAYKTTFFGLEHAVGRCIRMQNRVSHSVSWRLEEMKALIIGCHNGLPGVEKECDFLVEQLSQYIHVDYITGTDATKASVMHLLERPYDIVHYAGHAVPNGLSVSDGWITTRDINGFSGGGVVFINACGSGRGVTTAGLAHSFISSGASAFIGNFWSVHDETAAQLALDFYMRAFQLSGACLPVGESLRRAKLKSFERGDRVWINFVLYGDPQLLLL